MPLSLFIMSFVHMSEYFRMVLARIVHVQYTFLYLSLREEQMIQINLHVPYVAHRNKTAPMSEISKLSEVRDTIVEMFTFPLPFFLSFLSTLWYDSLLWNRG